MRFLLRPGWLALTAVVFTFAVCCFTLLSPWQFSRNTEREQQNSALETSFTAAPVPLAQLLPPGSVPGPHTEWHLVSITGQYLPDKEVVARLRTVQGEGAFEVLTPMRTTDGTVVLIDRGYVRPHNWHQHPMSDMREKIAPEIVVRAHAFAPDCGGPPSPTG